MNQMKIEYLPVASLHPYERNAKQHPPEQVEHIANSIREFGFRQPLVVDAENVVVIGHGRLMAAEKLGLDTVPVVRADDLSEAQIKALRLADNKTNESGWLFGTLEEELDGLRFDFDMSAFGFEDDYKLVEAEADAGQVEDNTSEPVAVTIRFDNVRLWRRYEQQVRDMIDDMDGASVSVGGVDENIKSKL